MSKLIDPDQGGDLARQMTRERIKRSKLTPTALPQNDPDLEVFRRVLRNEKAAKPRPVVSPRIIKKLA